MINHVYQGTLSSSSYRGASSTCCPSYSLIGDRRISKHTDGMVLKQSPDHAAWSCGAAATAVIPQPQTCDCSNRLRLSVRCQSSSIAVASAGWNAPFVSHTKLCDRSLLLAIAKWCLGCGRWRPSHRSCEHSWSPWRPGQSTPADFRMTRINIQPTHVRGGDYFNLLVCFCPWVAQRLCLEPNLGAVPFAVFLKVDKHVAKVAPAQYLAWYCILGANVCASMLGSQFGQNGLGMFGTILVSGPANSRAQWQCWLWSCTKTSSGMACISDFVFVGIDSHWQPMTSLVQLGRFVVLVGSVAVDCGPTSGAPKAGVFWFLSLDH